MVRRCCTADRTRALSRPAAGSDIGGLARSVHRPLTTSRIGDRGSTLLAIMIVIRMGRAVAVRCGCSSGTPFS